MGIHEDKDLNHICDYGCKDLIGQCIDSNLDHARDYGCEKTYGIHLDEDNNHLEINHVHPNHGKYILVIKKQ